MPLARTRLRRVLPPILLGGRCPRCEHRLCCLPSPPWAGPSICSPPALHLWTGTATGLPVFGSAYSPLLESPGAKEGCSVLCAQWEEQLSEWGVGPSWISQSAKTGSPQCCHWNPSGNNTSSMCLFKDFLFNGEWATSLKNEVANLFKNCLSFSRANYFLETYLVWVPGWLE